MAILASVRGVASLPFRAHKRRRKRLRSRRRQTVRRQQAVAAYEQLRTSTGRPHLDSATSRRIAEYCSEVLGSSDFQPWMRVYALYQRRFVEGWIPDDYFSMRVMPALSNGRPLIPDKRSLSRRLFATEAFPDVAYFINGQWFTTDYRVIASDQLLGHVFADGEEVYLKLEGTGRGVGVRRLGRSGFEPAIQSITENGVLQRAIVQHPWFDEIYPKAVATLRITTSYLDAAGPRFRASYLRIAYAGRTHVEAAKSLRWAVIDREGSMAAEALDETWRPHSRHPDSEFAFQDSQIPFFRESVDTCLGLHAMIPHCHIVGWDVGITKTGSVEIMEWNSAHTDIRFSEATVGPIFLGCGFERFARIELPTS